MPLLVFSTPYTWRLLLSHYCIKFDVSSGFSLAFLCYENLIWHFTDGNQALVFWYILDFTPESDVKMSKTLAQSLRIPRLLLKTGQTLGFASKFSSKVAPKIYLF